jgi:ribosomal protein S18 acetylase RimI-like enzyme
VKPQFYSMRPGQEGDVVRLIHELIADYGTDFECNLTPESLSAGLGFLNVEVAELDSEIVGFCAWTQSFSTWRGITGMHVCDLHVSPTLSQTSLSKQLLAFAASKGAAQGAKFIRTEVDITDPLAEDLYAEVGFWTQTRHTLNFLEPNKFDELIA